MEVVHGVHGHGPGGLPGVRWPDAQGVRRSRRSTSRAPGWAKKDRGAAASTKAAAKAAAGDGSASSGDDGSSARDAKDPKSSSGTTGDGAKDGGKGGASGPGHTTTPAKPSREAD